LPLENHDKPTKAVVVFGFYHSEQPPFMRAATETGPPVMKLGYEKLCASVTSSLDSQSEKSPQCLLHVQYRQE
jgi:hypothetical protein